MKSKIFISYARRDYDVVIKLRDEIQRRTGEFPWMDLSGIETGAQFADVIAGAIDACSLLVFVVSRHSVVSEWTRREMLYALETHKKIYPVVIDDVELPKELRLLLSNLNCIDIRDAVQRANFFSDLAVEVNDSPASSPSCRPGPVGGVISGIKALRFKMAMALLSRRSWALYSVIGILFLAVIAYMCMSHRGTKNLEAEIEPLKEFKADMDRNIESAKREARWAVCFRLPNLANTWQNNLKWRIDRVATTNEPLAVELRTLTEKMSVLGRRSEKLSDEIEGLREQAYEKREKGLDDEQEFKQASKLLMERKKTDAETEEIYNEILRRIGEK